MLKVTMIINNKVASPQSPSEFVKNEVLADSELYELVSLEVDQEDNFTSIGVDKAVLGSDRTKIIGVIGYGHPGGVCLKSSGEGLLKLHNTEGRFTIRENTGKLLYSSNETKNYLLGEFVQQSEEEKRAFEALMEYEIVMIKYYDRPGMHSLPPRKGHRMQDIALKHGTTIEEMKKQRNAIEDRLRRDGYDDFNNKRP